MRSSQDYSSYQVKKNVIAVEVEPESIIESTPESVSNLLLLACKFVAGPAALNISNTL